MAKHSYISKQSPSLKVNLGGGDRIVFQNRAFHTEDERLAEKIDAALRNPRMIHLHSQFYKLDYDAAKRIALTHKAEMEKHGAFKGAFTSQAHVRNAISQVELQHNEQALLASGASPEQIAEMRKKIEEDGLVLTSSAKGEVIRNEELKTTPVAEEDKNSDQQDAVKTVTKAFSMKKS